MKSFFEKSRIVLFTLFAIMLLCSFMLAGCRKEKEEVNNDEPKVEVSKDTKLIFSFDSYEDITSARLEVHNLLGKTAVNRDDKYITDGKGSWMIQPHGSWADEKSYPAFTIHCNPGFFQTSVETGDFFEFDKVLLDIYNDSDEEAQIRWTFSVMNTHGSYSTNMIEPVVCTLAPNAWTTCEYDLTDEMYNYFYMLDDVSAMKVEFLTKKESQDDVTPKLYLDNLRGHISETEREFEAATVDITKPLTFESVKEGYTVHGYTTNGVEIQRVAYADTTISGKDSSFGEYCMSGTAVGSRYLCFEVPYYETIKAGMVLTTWVYVEADAKTVEGMTYRMESMNSIEDRVSNTALNTGFEFNKWYKVAFKLGVDAKKAYVYPNLDGLNIPDFANFEATLYIDNVQVVPGEADVTKNSDGSYTLTNPHGLPAVTHKFDFAVKAGQSLAFDINMDPAIYSAIYIFGSNGKNQFETGLWPGWSGQKTIVAQIKEDIEWFSIRLEYRDTAYDPSKVVTKFSNIHTGKYGLGQGINFESKVDLAFMGLGNSAERVAYADTKVTPLNSSLGKYAWKYDGTKDRWPDFNLAFDKKYPEGTIVSFLMYVEADPEVVSGKTFAVESRLQRDGGTANKVLQGRSYPFNTWVQVDIQLGSECNQMYAYANMDSTIYPHYKVDTPTILGDAPVTVYVDNFSVAEYTTGAQENADGSVTFTNPLGLAELWHTFDVSAKAGQSIAFDVDMDPAIYSAVYVYSSSGKHLYETGLWPGWSGKTTLLAKAPEDLTGIKIKLEYRDAAYTARYNEITTTISNVHVGSYGVSNGITFESHVDLGYIGNANSEERVAYADTTVTPLNSSFGKYALKYDGTKDRWPDFSLEFDKKYPEGTIVSFMLYVEADPAAASGKTFVVESRLQRDGGTANKVLQGRNYSFNTWVKVSVELGSDCEQLYAYVNMDSSVYPQYGVDTPSILGDTPVSVYVDNISAAEYTTGATENADGSVTFSNPLGIPELYHTFNIPVEAGQVLALDIEMDPAIYSAIYVFGSNGKNMYENGLWPGWSGKTGINILVNEDIEWFKIRLEYRDPAYSTRYDEITTTIHAKATYDQEYMFTAPTNYPTIYNKAVKAGETITFNIQAEKAAPIVVWVQGVYKNESGATTYTEAAVKVYNTLAEAQTITATFSRDVEYVRIQVQTRKTAYGVASDVWTAGKLTVSNIKLTGKE